jgi:CheY-like chemotaxis protein
MSITHLIPPSVLIVEDELLVLTLTESILMEAGYETLAASDLPEAITLLRSNAEIDVLFTDIGLRSAVDGGLTLARKAVRLRPTIQVVYASARSVTDRKRNGFVDGAVFLPKPYCKAQVLATVGRWDHKERMAPPADEARGDLRPSHPV